jgi:cupin 2 domain-containing protein
MIAKNIYQPSIKSGHSKDEVFEPILKSDAFIIERIISSGQATPEGSWHDQETEEWVLLIQGESILEFENAEIIKMKPGDYIHIPAHTKHRVNSTSIEPYCIWLAIHLRNK